MNKKAQAQIITTVLIILLVLAAIVIVWQVINATVREGTEGIEGASDCFTTQLEIRSVKPAECSQSDSEGKPCKDVDSCEAAQAVGTCGGTWDPDIEVVAQRRSGGSGEINVAVLINGELQSQQIADLKPLESGKFTTTSNNATETVEVAAVFSPGTANENTCQPADIWNG